MRGRGGEAALAAAEIRPPPAAAAREADDAFARIAGSPRVTRNRLTGVVERGAGEPIKLDRRVEPCGRAEPAVAPELAGRANR